MSSSALPLNVSTPSKPAEGDKDRTPTSSGNSSTTKVGTIAPSDISSPHELTAFVESLLERLNSNFDDMSNQILDRSEYFGCVGIRQRSTGCIQ
ncbi:hypothetical protein AX14_007521 [Amanita brunnescens Koide BX004]|nr:hypothetical protein AX14_007521 [Amanita brunnescens Koide BX004]